SFQRNEGVILARVNNLCAQAALQQFAQTPADVDHKVFFQQAIGTNRSRVMSSVSGVNHNLADLQTERANQRSVAGRSRPRFSRINDGPRLRGLSLVSLVLAP